MITIHNNPENLALPPRFKHLRFQCADVDTVDASRFFAPAYAFIEEGRGAGEGAAAALYFACGLIRLRIMPRTCACKHAIALLAS